MQRDIAVARPANLVGFDETQESRQAVGRHPRPGRTRSLTPFDAYARSVSQLLRLLGNEALKMIIIRLGTVSQAMIILTPTDFQLI